MKNINIVIIIALLILVGYLYFSKGTGKEVSYDKAKYDSISETHISKYTEIQQKLDSAEKNIKATKEKAKSDSASYTKTISKLKKELKAAKFTGNASTVPDDTVQLAMDCLEREPIRDSIDSVNYARVAQLEQEKAELVKDYESIMHDNQEQKNELQSIINLKDQEIKEIYKKANKKFSVGPHAGYDPFQNKPSLGVSVQYTLFRF